MEEKFLKLTNTVYKVLEFFPESDPLKNRAKDKALAIMEHLVLNDAKALEDFDMLIGYLWVAKSQGWMNSVNYLIIANEYENLKKQFTPVISNPTIEPTEPQKAPAIVLSARQRQIDFDPQILPLLEKRFQRGNALNDFIIGNIKPKFFQCLDEQVAAIFVILSQA